MNRILQSLLIAIAALLPAIAGDRDLTAMSLEQLLNMEVVSVSKNHGKLSRTPAAVHVITREDIRRSGATSLPEALRLAPGVHVARIDGQSWAIGMRGFNASTSNKLLVMIDGRSIYNPVMSGVVWSTQLIMLEDVDRIEVIRGPAGAVWGANAVNGVINVVSRSAAQTIGTLAAVSGGSMDPARASLRQGGKIGENISWRAWTHSDMSGMGRELVPQPAQHPWYSTRAGFRLDWKAGERDELELHGELTTLRQHNNYFTYPRPGVVAIESAHTSSTGGFVLGKWTHINRRGDQSKLQLFEDIQQNDLGFVGVQVRTFDVDFQHSIGLSRAHSLVVGGGFRSSAVESENRPTLSFSPDNRTYYVGNVFLQHEWTLIPDVLALTLGAKVEQYTFVGTAFQPSARIIWTPTRHFALWGSASRAVRAPSHVDYALHYPIGAVAGQPLPFFINILGSKNSRPESLRGFELGTRIQLSSRTLVDISVYRNSFTRLNDTYQVPFPLDPATLRAVLSLFPLPTSSAQAFSIPAIQVNGRDITASGGEVEIHHEIKPWWRLTGSYSSSLLSTRIRPEFDPSTLLDLTNLYPRHMAQIRSSWDISRRWLADVQVYRTTSLVDRARSLLGPSTRVDARIEWKFLARTSLSLQGQNLLRPWQTEYPGESLYPNRSIGRSISLAVRWER